MTQNRLDDLTVAGRASAFLWSIFMHGKTGRVDPEFDELPYVNVLFQNRVRYSEVDWILGVHGDTIDQLIAIGESLFSEFMLQDFASH